MSLVRELGDGGLGFKTKSFTITRGGKETFHAHLELAQAKVARGRGKIR